ncbi:TPA: hypothetical protein DDW35_04750 [Candidatus Sumerlaeota bacterium]|jgi:malonyl-CoA O-methyltransferase|nr:hypothetical protein [Candidatus Sumerlaeota bacterium]
MFGVQTFCKKVLRRLAQAAKPAPSPDAAPRRVLRWLAAQERAGLGASSGMAGLLLPSLFALGHRDFAQRQLAWLLSSQQADGSWTNAENQTLLNTAQALWGLTAALERGENCKQALERAANYILQKLPEKAEGQQALSALCSLPALLAANRLLHLPDPETAIAKRAVTYQEGIALAKLPLRDRVPALDALLNLGLHDQAVPLLQSLAETQIEKNNPDVIAQLAACWYKIGCQEAADRAMLHLEQGQQKSGALSRNKAEALAASVFFLAAHPLRVDAFFKGITHLLPEKISPEDERFQALLAVVRPGDKVLDAGCGKGRFLKQLKIHAPEVNGYGMDISPELLAHLPDDIPTRIGAVEEIPFPDNYFDVTFACESLEFTQNLEQAVSELIRVTRPGGWVLIVDKDLKQTGWLECPSWEKWLDAKTIIKLLSVGCENPRHRPIGYNNQPPDGLMLLWQGQKNEIKNGDAR